MTDGAATIRMETRLSNECNPTGLCFATDVNQQNSNPQTENSVCNTKEKTMRGTKRLYVVFLTLMIAIGCDNDSDRDGPVGSAKISISRLALLAENIARLKITVSGNNISPVIEMEVENSQNGAWSGLINDIPVGDGVTFHAEAFDSENTLIYSGSATEVSIIPDQTIQVILILQQVDPPAGFENGVPRFESLVVSASQVVPGTTVEIQARASDPDQETMEYGWLPADECFDRTDVLSVVWTAPGAEGVYELTVSATDPKGARATLSFALEVSSGVGGAEVVVNVNNAPEVLGLVPHPSRLDVGESTDLVLSTTDADGDTLSYSWTADCAGTFSDSTAENPSFTLTEDNENGDCALSVAVTDGRGGENRATIGISTGPGITPGPPGQGESLDFELDERINYGSKNEETRTLTFIAGQQFSAGLALHSLEVRYVAHSQSYSNYAKNGVGIVLLQDGNVIASGEETYNSESTTGSPIPGHEHSQTFSDLPLRSGEEVTIELTVWAGDFMNYLSRVEVRSFASTP